MSRSYKVKLKRQSDGMYLAVSDSPTCMARARTEEEALEGIRAEIRYRIEYCPCSGVEEDYVQLEVVRAG